MMKVENFMMLLLKQVLQAIKGPNKANLTFNKE